MKNSHLKDNPKLRKIFRILGLILTMLGGTFIIIGFIDVFSADMFHQPTKAWMIFLGMVITFPGFVCLSFGFMGSVARYQASEVAPVAKDTANYMIDGTRDELVKTINQVRSGKNIIHCPKCGEDVDNDSSFCNHCGYKIEVTCTKCNTKNDSDSEYCKKCGNKLGD